jgi:hypothetical protein
VNKRIPIRVARDIAKEFDLDQVIVLAYERDAEKQEQMTHVVTYGKSVDDCVQAAEGGNKLKRMLGWPENLCHAKPARQKRKETT